MHDTNLMVTVYKNFSNTIFSEMYLFNTKSSELSYLYLWDVSILPWLPVLPQGQHVDNEAEMSMSPNPFLSCAVLATLIKKRQDFAHSFLLFGCRYSRKNPPIHREACSGRSSVDNMNITYGMEWWCKKYCPFYYSRSQQIKALKQQ